MINRKLIHRITIEEYTSIQDPISGAIVNGWKPYKEGVAARVTPLSSKELMSSNAEQAQLSARILIRYDQNITSDMRVKFRSLIYVIEGQPVPDNESGLEWLTLNVSEGLKDE